MLAGPGAENVQLDPISVTAAYELHGHVTDPKLLGVAPGLPPRKVNGTCRICTNLEELSYEHLPPKAAGNAERTTGVNAWEALDPRYEGPPRKIAAQRGSGAFVLCRTCNSYCGQKYVNDYVAFDAAVEQGIASRIVETPTGPGYPQEFELELAGWELGSIARQALAMLLAASGGGAIASLYPELADCVLCQTVPVTNVRLGLSLAVGTKVRLSPPIILATAGGVSVFGEVAASPFRWTISWNVDHLVPPPASTDVTHWLTLAPNVRSGPETQIFGLGAIESAATGDMRFPAEIEAQIATNGSDE